MSATRFSRRELMAAIAAACVVPKLTRWPFGDLPRHCFKVIYADPPWRFVTRSAKGQGRSADRHYPTMSLEEMAALPVQDLAADDCALFMWAYDAMLPEAVWLMTQWGFDLKSRAFDWEKTLPSGKRPIGKGYWTRHGGEQCWIGTIGRPRRRSRAVRQYLEADLREHSRKPAEVARRIEQLVDGPYVELFQRTGRDGWRAWGKDVGRFGVER